MSVPDRETGAEPWAVVRPLSVRDAPESEETGESEEDDRAPVPPAAPTTAREGWPTRGERYAGPESCWVWIGAHGGAGVTALARTSDVPAEVAGGWPNPALGWPEVGVLVARTSARGMEALRPALTDMAHHKLPHGFTVIAVVLMADAPRTVPRSVRGAIRALRGAAPAVLHVPWISDWRAEPDTGHASITRLVQQVEALHPPVANSDSSH